VKLLLLEVVFVLLFLAGVALVYVPAALILGGLLGVVAVERASARGRPLVRPVSDLRERRSA
jgi:uncharacterized membrane-anchored protein YitT (DUF2179 family)